jgi:hypothetical protein
MAKKKFITAVIILLAAGSAGAFFTGWAQFPVPLGSYGVLRSKTHGLHGPVIKDGRFTWLWYKLIPGNAKTLVFGIKPQTLGITAEGSLPQAETYISFAGLDASFRWRVTGSVSFALDPDSLPDLAETNGIDGQTALDAYTSSLGAKIAAFVRQRIAHYCGQKEGLDRINSGDYERLDGDVRAAFPSVTGLSFSLAADTIPDYGLFEAAKALYDDYIAYQHSALDAEVKANAALRIDTQFRLEELARYGELLSKYPLLLDYLKLEGR